MFDNLFSLAPEIGHAIAETGLMLLISVSAAVLIGIPIGVFLYFTGSGQIYERPALFRITNYVVNTIRSLPFIILLVALIPITRTIVGTTIGPVAATVPLSIVSIAYLSRLVEQSLREIPKGIIEAALGMGATPLQITWKVVLAEARSGILSGITITTISLLSYTAMAGIVGGGGIGDLAIRFGYYRFQTDVMIFTVILLIVFVHIIQFTGNTLVKRLDKR
ncbi:ABC transporter permease [Paenibacillus validus]|uniref:ABC transporter permease subunit n=1 Tax=Paenibacillus validus TaxID=44253 RepID=A0A7X2ZAC5_9BACL|nr:MULTISPECIES: methionine ABC transporter permease [Paenibacillus]MED4599779.1 ABC transporter permease [Paenibacillus validus]MED4604686.1 ABC transporter permease [Paenibacillus validus]MUG70670.1 ABC transporter permease subunit [Paenibacillus validus]